MSHPDPHHDQENERIDDDLLRQEDEARRLEDAQTVQDEMQREQDKINAYADAMIRRDKEQSIVSHEWEAFNERSRSADTEKTGLQLKGNRK
jgi:hypothetical protein